MAKKNVHLTEDLIIEILLKLTVKNIIRCKCVCKSWFSLICNPDFAISHFQLAATPTNKLVCSAKYSDTLFIDVNASLNNESSYTWLNHNFLPPGSCTKIGGCCRGFIFLHTYTDLFYLWNPSTGVHTKIPASPITLTISDTYLSTYLYGLAYDHSTDDYLIVLGSCDCPFDIHVSCVIYFEIFSLRANKWKHIEVDSHITIYFECCSDVGLLANDSIHWMVYNDDTNKDVIIAFDFKESRISEIALPDGFDYKHYPINHNLLVFGGLICASIVKMYTMKIWVMQEYGVHSSWTKMIEFSVDPVLHNSLSIECFTNCGDLIGRHGGGGLVKFDDKGQLLEHHYGPKFQMVAVYEESLLSLPCGIEQL